MTASQIHQMDTIANPRPIRALLRDVWEKIIGDAVGIFTELAAFLGPHRIEIVEDRRLPVRIAERRSRRISSIMNLVRPYGLMGDNGNPSVMGISCGLP